jgi:nucleoid DNA-binding protein
VSKLMPKSEIIRKIAEQLSNEVTHNDIKRVLDALADVGHAELKQSGAFLLPDTRYFRSRKSRPPRRTRASIRLRRSR